jgi:hypothetical protein
LTSFKTAAALLLLSLCVVCAAPSPSGASRAAQGRVTVRAKGRRSVVLTERGRSHTLDLTKHIDAAKIEDVSLLLLTYGGEFAYVVLNVCGLSKMPPDDRQCGAGIECNVVWLKLDRARRVSDGQNARYESCWAPITSGEGPQVSGRRLTLALEDLREEVRREVTYDADSPEGGLKVTQTPLPKEPGQNRPR